MWFPTEAGFVMYVSAGSSSKLLSAVKVDAFDVRALNKPGKKGPLNAWEIQENHNLFLNSARACGCPLLNIGPADLQQGTVCPCIALPSKIILSYVGLRG